ncbi:SsrA-binding protein SmpB [Candidatus Riesia pediculischaeffi]|uniref:SsrA-binding protein n=1 Tax=Candidatus Riesia pediculischaeffi TaxID=428411 RepID=A0A1V0HKF2_9ENTR|nr:SsrA-binding protein SmpB [Candidatus Riesia pediculischaeffi]ARC53304.1 hypothetical protein AOQ87_01255 [Candidatus Riesia pediculischaeffi]
MIRKDKKIQMIAFNKKSFYNYSIQEIIEAGIILYGWEVRSIRQKKVDITNSYITIKDKEVYVLEMNITPEKTVTTLKKSSDKKRPKKLLLKKNEILSISSYINQERCAVVVVSLYWKKNICKIKIGIGKGKNKYDKRAKIKENEWRINKIRTLKNLNFMLE